MDKKRVKKLTPNQIEFTKQIKRINNAVKRLKKRGFEFYDLDIPDEMPKRVTKHQLEYLKSRTTETLLHKAVWLDPRIGVTVNKDIVKAERLYRRSIQRPKNGVTNIGYKPPDKKIVKLDIFEQIENRINDIPDELILLARKRRDIKTIDISSKRAKVLEHYHLKQSEAREMGESAVEKYAHYLDKNSDLISNLISEIINCPASKSHLIDTFIGDLITLITGDPLSIDEIDSLSVFDSYSENELY